MPRQRTAKPRSLRHATLGQAIELVMAEDARMTLDTVAAESGLDESRSALSSAARATRHTAPCSSCATACT
jgi:hypothetical protein